MKGRRNDFMIREQNESSGANLVVGRRNQKGGGDDNVGESAKS